MASAAPLEAPCKYNQKQHEGEIYSLKYADGHLYTAGADKIARQWDARKGKVNKQFKGHDDTIWCMAVEGDMLYTGSADNNVKSWEISKGKEKDTLAGHKKQIFALEVRNGTVFSGSDDKTIYKRVPGAAPLVYKGHKNTVLCMQLVDRVLYTGSTDFSVRSWDTETNEGLVAFKGHRDTVYCLKVVDGVLYTGSRDGSAKAWNASTGENVHTFSGHTNRITCLDIFKAPNLGLLLTGSADSTVRSWDINTGVARHVFQGHTHTVLSMVLVGNLLYTGSADHNIYAWNVVSGDRVGACTGHTGWVLQLAYSPETAGVLYSACKEGTVRAWDVSGHQATGQSATVVVDDRPVIRVFLADNSYRAMLVNATSTVDETVNQAITKLSLPGTGWMLFENTGETQKPLNANDNVLDLKSRFGNNSKFLLCRPSDLGSIQAIKEDDGGHSSPAGRRPSTAVSDGHLLAAHAATIAQQQRDASGKLGAPAGAAAPAPSISVSDAPSGASSAEVESLRAQNAALQAQVAELRTRPAAGASAAALNTSSAGSASDARVSDLEGQLAAARNEARSLQGQLQDANAAAAASRESQALLASKGANAAQELAVKNEKLTADLSSAQQNVRQLERKVADLEAQHAAEAGKLKEALEKTQGGLEKENRRLEKELAATTAELATTKSQLQTESERAARLEKEKADVAKRFEQLEAVAKDAADTKARNEARIAELERTTQELTASTTRMENALQKEQRMRIKYYNECEDLKGKIRVYGRIRPMSENELAEGHTVVVNTIDDASLNVKQDRKDKDFQFTRCFGSESTQEQVFEDTKMLIQSAVDGYNVCIFAYGQTGSGKTFTMAGYPGSPGITPRAVRELFMLIDRDAAKFVTNIEIEMLELYNDNLEDLLWPGRDDPRQRDNAPRLDIHRDAKGTVSVSEITAVPARTVEEVEAIIERGNAHRHVAATLMNAGSSRSHLVITIKINRTNRSSGTPTNSKLTLVDLAGSERVAKSGADKDKDLMKEAQSINKSLTALGDVIAALSSADGTPDHVPYRNNKLTFLLSDAIGGNAKTLMFVNVSPASYNTDETLNSLGYAARVKEIRNDASKNVESKEIQRLKAIIKELKGGA